MLKKVQWLTLIVTSLIITGCASQWYLYQPSKEALSRGWQKYYLAIYDGYRLAVSLGSCAEGEMIALDCQRITSNISYRLFATIDRETAFDIHLFKYVNGQVIGSIPRERREFWQECYLRILPQQKIFTKLPEDLQKKAKLAIEAANYKFSQNSYFP